jgi:hypothetical protein
VRLLRLRRRDGVACCITIELFDYEVEEMIRQGLLNRQQTSDRGAVMDALGKIVENWFNQN